MVWVTTEAQLDHILTGCEGKGWPPIDTAWRDEAKLTVVWNAAGWPTAPRMGMAAFPAGGELVAWISIWGRKDGRTDGEPLWALSCIAPDDGKRWRAYEDGPADRVDLWNARNFGATPKAGPIESGGRIALALGRGPCRIGKAVTVLRTGAAATVQLEPGGDPVSGIGQRWFPVRGRDEAFDWFWERGRVTFRHYMAMGGQLYHKQRKITGDAERHGKKSRIPGGGAAPETRPPKPAAPVAADPTPKDLAAEVQRLKEGYARAEAHFEQVNAAMLATAEGTPEADRAMALQNAAEQAMAEAWDAWDAAEKQWIAELMD